MQLEAHVDTQANIKIVVFESVAENNRDFEHHDINAGFVGVSIHILFVGVMSVVEGKFRDEAQVLDHEVHLEQEAASALETEFPTVGIFTKEGIDTALGADTQQHGALESFVTHTVDFGLLGSFGFVASVGTCVFFVVCEFTVGRTVVRRVVARRTCGRGGGCPTFVIITLSHGRHRKCQNHGDCYTQSLQIHSLIIINEHVNPAYKIISACKNSAENFFYLTGGVTEVPEKFRAGTWRPK